MPKIYRQLVTPSLKADKYTLPLMEGHRVFVIDPKRNSWLVTFLKPQKCSRGRRNMHINMA